MVVAPRRLRAARLLVFGSTLALAASLLPQTAPAAEALPSGFSQTTVFSGLTTPTKVVFANDGRVFVAEKGGKIKEFDSLTDTSATIVADFSTNVYDYWDRGLLGFTLAPNFPTDPYAYVLYTYDHILGDSVAAPRWNDGCPTPPSPTGDGCVASGRLSRFQIAGNVMTGPEQVLIEDWCQQYPSHSIGDVRFGADGMLYVTGGDGASFTFTDYGQDGNPVNPCGDPPGGTMSPPTAEGGALRSQDIRTAGDTQGYNGTVLRLDPATGQAAPGNPLIGNPDLKVRRIIATGMRNPFKTTIRPGTNEIWAGDVGEGTWEEVDRVDWSTSLLNYGWPCYEGVPRQGNWDGLNVNICENLYAAGTSAVRAPYYTYRHDQTLVGESCSATNGSSISGLAFYTGTSYPASYQNALFFADYSRDCMWVMFKGANGLPDPTNIVPFLTPAANPVDIEIGPNGDIFYADFDGGRIQRVTYQSVGNQAPTAVASATPSSGPAPLTVNFSATSSTDPNGDPLTYAWDLDGDGAYNDSTSATPSRVYSAAGSVTVGLRVTDPGGLSGTTTVTVTATSGNGSLVYLSDLTPTSAVNGWGPYERDMSNGENAAGDGNPITLGTTVYPKGLGTHALSDLHFPIATNCTSFLADVGLDEEVGALGAVTFLVYTNGTLRYTSPALTGASATQSVNVSLSNVSDLRLVVQPGTTDDHDHADWANARVTCGATGNQAPTAVASATPSSGPAPLTVNFSATSSTDPNGDPLTYAWDLDGDGAYNDSTSATPSRVYSAAGSVTVGLRVTDPGGLSGTTTVTVTATSGNGAPNAVAAAVPTSGPAPLQVAFSAAGSTDPNGDTLTYAWDLDGDGAYDDSTSATPSWTYTSAGSVTVQLRASDPGGLSDTDSLTITVSPPDAPPVPTIDAPTADLTWAVDDTIDFAGGATDAEDGVLAPSALTWTVIMHHCVAGGGCHTHQIQTIAGVDHGSFVAPDHEYPSHLELKLTATDSAGVTASTSVLLQPKTVDLTFTSAPNTGLQLFVGNVAGTTPFTRTIIVNGRVTATAVTPQTVGASTYTFQSWSDGGAASHEITAPTAPATYTATFSKQTAVTVTPVADAYIRSTQASKNFGTAKTLQVRANNFRSYLRFTVSGLTGTVTGAKLRLRVTDASANGGRLYSVAGGWTETGITWNNAPVISGTPTASLGAATVGTWLEVDVSRLVTGNGTYNVAISDGNSDTTQFSSREGTNPPQLVLTVSP